MPTPFDSTQAGDASPLATSLEPLLKGSLSLDSTFGVYMLGAFVSVALYGLIIHQLYRYARLYSKDTPYIKVLVIVVMLFETLHVAMAVYICYYYLVSNYAQPVVFLRSFWAVTFQPVLLSLITSVSQIFFARRVMLLGRVPRIIVALVATLLIGHVGIGIAVAVKIANGGIVTIAGRVADWLCLASYTSATLADILLSGTIIHAVRHSRANHQEKDAYIDVFLLYVINTGLLTGICNAIGTIMVGVKFSNNIRATAFNFVVCRLYANTLLSVLNSRKLLLSRGMEILDGKVLGRNFLARANHLAMAERWNVPESGQHNNEIPIMVNVSAETQTDQSDAIGEKRGKLEPNRRSSTSTD